MTDYNLLYEALQKQFAELKAELNLLREENKQIKEENQQLKIANQQLREENAHLKDRLGLNSRNSGIPSSKELYKLKKLTKKSKNKPGGQLGHNGNFRVRVTPDEIIAISLPKTCECGDIIIGDDKPYIIQKAELPEIKPIFTDYHLEQGKCAKCKRYYRARLPEGVTSDLLGPVAKTIISTLTGFFKNSKREVQSIVNNIFKLNISLGTISNTEKRISIKCDSGYEELEAAIKNSAMLNIDETSHYSKDKNGWCWMFTNSDSSLIKLCYSRGRKVLIEQLPDYQGLVISDRYSAYNHFTQRQICLAHITRDFERLANSKYPQISQLGSCLSDKLKELFIFHKLMTGSKIKASYFIKKAKRLRKKINYYLRQILKLSIFSIKGIAKNLLKAEPLIWKFLDDPPSIPLTNNLAERQIRHYVVYRKNSYFTQSERGDRFLERTISLYLTWKQNGLNPFDELLKLAKAG